MRCVVKVPGLSSIYSLTEVPADREGLEVEEGAWIEIPADIADYPTGVDNPPRGRSRFPGPTRNTTSCSSIRRKSSGTVSSRRG